jgi:hypothetical protein
MPTGFDLLLRLTIAALATWRLASLFVNEDGPFDVFYRLRAWAGAIESGSDAVPVTNLGKLLSCLWCASVWTGALCAGLALLPPPWWYIGLAPLALSAVALLLDRGD